MAAFTVSSVYVNTNATTFREWGKTVSDAIAALGWIKTADTGQIDWNTVAVPTSTNQSMGYEIWRSNDDRPEIRLKIEYGSGNGATWPAIWITVGTGSNGTGSITGHSFARTQRPAGNTSATSIAHVFSGNSGRISFVLAHGGVAAAGILLNIERTRDAAGNITDEGFIVFSIGNFNAGSMSIQFISFTSGPGPLQFTGGSITVAMPNTGGGASGTAVAIFPIFPTKGILLNPLIGFIAYFVATIVDGSSPQFPYYGALRTYIPIGNKFTASYFSGSPTGASLLMLYE